MKSGVITLIYLHPNHTKMLRNLLYGVFFFLIGHISVFFQLNGQFKWTWFKENPLWLAIAGIPISFMYIYGTKYTVMGFDGQMWSARFTGFAVGMVVYAFGVAYFFNQGITPKVATSLVLALILLSIQIFWK